MDHEQTVAGAEEDGGAIDGGVRGTPAPAELSQETVFDTLSNTRRRYALHYLKQQGEPVTVRDLSEQVAAWETDQARSAVTPRERKRVYTALHQTHLPRMDRAGVVTYDGDRGTVELTPAIAAFDIYLEVVPESELDWSEFYLGFGMVSVALSVVVLLEVYPFSLVPGIGYALLVSLSLLVAATVNYVKSRPTRLGKTERPPELRNVGD